VVTTPHDTGFDHLDGNALAGPLREVFAVDVTSARTQCVGCGQRASVGELETYLGGPGVVARCPDCHAAVLRYARTPTTAYLDLRGTLTMRIPMPDLEAEGYSGS
jgi:hypothetical protein